MARSREQISNGIQNEFIPAVKSTFGERLDTIILYGSYLKDSFVPGVSDVNVLILLTEVDAGLLRGFGKATYRLIRRYRITPQVLSRSEFIGSADVFPMEYLDIVDTHKTVHGTDVTSELDLTREHLRHELEHQLRGNLLSLRQLAVAAGRPVFMGRRVLRRELEGWYGSLGAILRGVLRLYGVGDVPTDPRAVVARVSETVSLSPDPVIGLLECRGGECGDVVTLMNEVIGWLARLVEIVDSVDSTAGGSE